MNKHTCHDLLAEYLAKGGCWLHDGTWWWCCIHARYWVHGWADKNLALDNLLVHDL